MKVKYHTLCYRVMYRNKVSDKWIERDFAIEDIAYTHYQIVREQYKYAKMLKIEKAE